jgi:phosphotransacetylase
MIEASATLENRTFDEITVGDSASVTKTLTRDDIALFGLLDGPLALDNTISEEAARIKRIESAVAGRADSVRTRMASCAVAALYAPARRRSRAVIAAE